MARLIDREFSAARNLHGGDAAPALVRDLAHKLDAFLFQCGDSGLNVFAHQVKLMAPFHLRCIGWVNSELGRRQRKDEPAVSRVDKGHPQRVAKKGARRFGILRKNDGMGSVDQLHIAKLTCFSRADARTLFSSGEPTLMRTPFGIPKLSR